MPQIRGNSFAKIYSVVKMQQICKETKKNVCNSYFFKDECTTRFSKKVKVFIMAQC